MALVCFVSLSQRQMVESSRSLSLDRSEGRCATTTATTRGRLCSTVDSRRLRVAESHLPYESLLCFFRFSIILFLFFKQKIRTHTLLISLNQFVNSGLCLFVAPFNFALCLHSFVDSLSADRESGPSRVSVTAVWLDRDRLTFI